MNNLTAAEEDALREICNIGVSQGARQLSILLGDEVIITVPSVDIIDVKNVNEDLGINEHTKVVAVSQHLHGSFDGTVSLMFHTQEGKSLVKNLIGNVHVISGVDIRDLEHEALVEIGNIIISSCMSAIANFLGEEISFGVPFFRETSLHQLLTATENDELTNKQLGSALIIKTTLQASKSDVSGALVMAFTMASADHLIVKVDDLVNKYRSDLTE
ncbi:MAG: hypothetical protein COB66_07680 [Coxiella sp. (in: Bacteria)]|nr:MAG: hypothetical protein COB66_07680 [Coxiella sp. (in: g-proteobacteria)]